MGVLEDLKSHALMVVIRDMLAKTMQVIIA
jgi:hypothetical protein